MTPTLADSVYVTDKISRYHLAEEFGHMRLFHEMFETFRLDRVQWVPLAPWVRRAYAFFTRMPPALMASAAFVTELMGFTVYLHLDRILDTISYGWGARRTYAMNWAGPSFVVSSASGPLPTMNSRSGSVLPRVRASSAHAPPTVITTSEQRNASRSPASNNR